MNKKKKILIIGELYSDNLGDGIICDIVQKMLNNFDIATLDLSGRTSYNTEFKYSTFSLKNEYKKYVKEKIKKNLKKRNIVISTKKLNLIFDDFKNLFEKKINKPDIILFSGGQLFMSCFLKPIKYIIEYAEKNSINVFFNACGIGNLYGKNEINDIQNILNSKCVSYISVRDGYKYLNSLNINNQITETYDTAILCNKFYKQKTKSSNKIGLGIMISHQINVKKQIKFWTSIIKQLECNNQQWEIFCNGSIEDYEFAKYILNKLHLNIKQHLKERPTVPNKLINDICTYEKIISMRLHSLIVAYSYDIPAIAISWDKKVVTFYNKIKQKQLCFNINSNTKQIINTLENISNTKNDKNKINIQNEITNNINKMTQLINQETL